MGHRNTGSKSSNRSPKSYIRPRALLDRKSTRLNSSHGYISYAVFCLKKTTQDQLIAQYIAHVQYVVNISNVPSALKMRAPPSNRQQLDVSTRDMGAQRSTDATTVRAE